jgi:hypothetical protein
MRIIRLFAISDQEQPSKPETRNLTLDLDWSNYTEIDCWLPTSNEIPYFETGGTDVVTFSGGLSYRRTGTKEGDRFGYQFPVKTENLGKPHVVVVEYPALDKQTLNARTMEIDIIEPQGPVIQTGVFTGGEYPCGSDENQWKQHRIIFWPQHEKNLITIVNRWAGHRAGAICIYIFPILEDEAGAFFPKTNVMTPPGYEGRLLGLWWEEPTIPREFGVPVYYDQNGSPYYGTPSITDFHEALEHMIDYLHYTGQNLVVYPIYFYDDPVYPSRIEGWPLHGEKGLMHPDDWFELMLKMCEANDISVIASFTMKSIPSLEPDKYFLPGRDGGEYKEKWESLLEQRAHDIFDEVLDEYGDLPALKGLSFNVWGQPDKVINVRLKNGKLKRWFDSVLWMDYSDTDYGNICGSIGECRSDLKLVISEWLPYDTDIVRLPGYLDKVQRIRDIYDQAGVRLNHGLTSRWERIRIERVLRLSFYRESLSHGGGSIHLLNAFFTSQDYYQSCYHLFWKENNTAAAIYNGYFEGGWNGMYSNLP